MTFLYNQSPNLSLLSIKKKLEDMEALGLNTKKLFVDAKELDKFEELPSGASIPCSVMTTSKQ